MLINNELNNELKNLENKITSSDDDFVPIKQIVSKYTGYNFSFTELNNDSIEALKGKEIPYYIIEATNSIVPPSKYKISKIQKRLEIIKSPANYNITSKLIVMVYHNNDKVYLEETLNKSIKDGRLLLTTKLKGMLFLYSILRTVKIKMVYDLPAAAATNCIDEIYLNPAELIFFKPKHILFVLFHELFHIIFKHRRFEKTMTESRWCYGQQDDYVKIGNLANIVEDYNINSRIVDIMSTEKDINSYVPMSIPMCYHRDYNHNKFGPLELYKHITDLCFIPDDESEEEQSDCDNKNGNGGDGSNPQNKNNNGNPLKNGFDSHEYGESKRKEISKPEQEARIRDMEGNIRNAVESAQMANRSKNVVGNSPVSKLLDYILQELEPKVDWRSVLRNDVQMVLSRKELIDRKNYEIVRMALHKSFKNIYKAPNVDINIIIDTSGSMINEIPNILNEVYQIVKQFKNFTITIITCDCVVEYVETFTSTNFTNPKAIANKIGKSMKGGGGTSFIPPFVYLKENKQGKWQGSSISDKVYYFTDGCGDFPEGDLITRFKTTWVINENNSKMKDQFPFGRVITYYTTTL